MIETSFGKPARTRLHVLLVLTFGVVLASAYTVVVRSEEADSVPPPTAADEAQGGGGRTAFRDLTATAGIDFRHTNGASGSFEIREIMSGGGGFLDYDGDGNLDIFLIQSCVEDQPETPCSSRLYRNSGDGTFADVTEQSGAGAGGYGMGFAAADHDSDGDVDIFVTRVGPDLLLGNNGDGTFTDITDVAGVGDSGFGSSAAFLDYDRDGYLDLFVARYIGSQPSVGDTCRDLFVGQRDYCNPTQYPPATHLLYRNLGNGSFSDVSRRAGIHRKAGYGLAVLCTDVDDDGWVDIYVANDQSPAFLWHNEGDGQFREMGVMSGCALNGEGATIAGMGLVAEDFDSDGDLDLFVTNIRRRSHLFLRNTKGLFQDVSHRWGTRDWLLPDTGFGAVCFDQDLDGSMDLFIANGSVSRIAEPNRPDHPYAESNVFLRWEAGRFVDASTLVAPEILAPAVSRGLAFGDYDNDGDVDLLVCRNNTTPQLLRNEQASARHWVGFVVLEQNGSSPVPNARVTLEADGRRQVREVRPQQSYLASHDPRVHFGLGVSSSIERVSVRWTDGSSEVWDDVPLDRYVTLRRGEGEESLR